MKAIRPIFIGGCSRSGTTFLASLLGNCDGAVVTPESQFKIDVLRAVTRSPRSLWRLRVWGLDPVEYGAILRDHSGTDAIERLVCSYAKNIGKNDPDIWVDHTPDNMRYVATILEHYKSAYFVHLVRDGRGVGASVLPLVWGPTNVYDAAEWWLAQLSYGLAAEISHPDRVIRVRYEDVLRNPAAEIKRICEFGDIPYDPSMLDGSGFSVPKYTKGQHSLVGSEPQITRTEAWRESLTARQIEIFEDRAADMLSFLGYAPDYTTPRPATFMERVRYRLALLTIAKNKAVSRWRILRAK